MDYSQLSDFEINKRVGIALGKELMPDDCQDFGSSGFPEVMLRNGDIKDYCNDPTDAWPIIAKCKIDISWGDNTPAPDEWGFADARCLNSKLDEFEYYEKSGNALRAAMIAFLMMQDAKHA